MKTTTLWQIQHKAVSSFTVLFSLYPKYFQTADFMLFVFVIRLSPLILLLESLATVPVN